MGDATRLEQRYLKDHIKEGLLNKMVFIHHQLKKTLALNFTMS